MLSFTKQTMITTNRMMSIMTPPTIPKIRESMLFTSGLDLLLASTTFLLDREAFFPVLEDFVVGATDQMMSSVVLGPGVVEVVVVVEMEPGSGIGVVLEPESQVKSSGVRERTEVPSSFRGPPHKTWLKSDHVIIFGTE